MFRFMMHLVGGLGLIVVALSLGIFGKRSGSSLYTAEGRSEHVVPNVVQTTQLILRITLVIIFIAAVVLTALCIFNRHGACPRCAAIDLAGNFRVHHRRLRTHG